MIQPLGKVTVAVAGVPTKILTNAALVGGRPACHAILIQALHSNVGKVFVGTSTMNKSAMTDILGTLAIPTVNFIPTFSAGLTLAPAGVNLADLYIDADVANDGVTVTILVT